MKTTTVADLRNNFRRISALIEGGESIAITKRGRVIATLIPGTPKSRKLVKPDFRAQLREVWGHRCFTAAEVKAMRDFELLGEDG